MTREEIISKRNELQEKLWEYYGLVDETLFELKEMDGKIARLEAEDERD
ncbi:hypothetical protein [Floricoccus tropicus]|nr:hypothetical protein [Floricoccus tropicus]